MAIEFLRSAINAVKSKGFLNAVREATPKGIMCALFLNGFGSAYLKPLFPASLGLYHLSSRSDGCKSSIIDGNLMETKLHSIGAKLVGVDQFGNKYYEKLFNTQFGRHRWVDYADKKNYNASSVPPEWHGWLHYITDHTPEQLEELKPIRYGIEHKPNLSGLGDEFTYHSKGHALNENQRDWTRYQSWQSSEQKVQ